MSSVPSRPLAVSNIAWSPEEDSVVAAVMSELGIDGLEVAPTMIWERPLEVSESQATEYRSTWERRGIRIVSMQALLFGRPDLELFADEATRCATLEYLRAIIRLAGWLGCNALVFGSPKNRLRRETSIEAANSTAVEFFRRLGDAALRCSVGLCIEPNPEEYGADYVTTAGEGLSLVREVDSAGFRLHLDSGAMTLVGEDPGAVLDEAAEFVGHYHVSEPFLAPVGEGGVDHEQFAGALQDVGYDGWCSIEMRRVANRDAGVEMRRALEFAKRVYGSV